MAGPREGRPTRASLWKKWGGLESGESEGLVMEKIWDRKRGGAAAAEDDRTPERGRRPTTIEGVAG